MTLDSIGKYVNLQPIGHGGMAEVYKGYDPDLDRLVAIKVILPHLASEPGFEERFKREARLIASLRHPNIVQIYEFGVQDNRPFMVMEYLPGGSLQDKLRQNRAEGKRLSMPDVIRFVEPLADALDFAHTRGAVHRDIKPANILFSLQGDPVIVDFGIVKLMDESIRLTGTGSVIGSPHYMSPEQASSNPVTKASDVYSLGVVLYEMAAGRVPFQGDSITGILMQHLTDPPPLPRELNPNLSQAIERVILKTLAKKPVDRFRDGKELITALKQAHAQSESTGISLEAATLVETSDDIPSIDPSIQVKQLVTEVDKAYRQEPSPETRPPTLETQKPKGVGFPKQTIFKISLGILSLLVLLVVLSFTGILEIFPNPFSGKNEDVLLYSTLDEKESIHSPEIGIGGRTSLLSSDFVPGRKANGILFVRGGGEECQNEDFQEVSFPAWQGNRFNVNMEASGLTFWYQPQFDSTDLVGIYNLFAITSEGGTPPYISLEFFDGQLHLIVEDLEGSWFETASPYQSQTWRSGDWIFIRTEWDANDDQDSLRIYIDEERVDNGQVPGGWQIDVTGTDIRINIGSNSPCGNPVANGIIDELTIYRLP